MKSLLCVAGLAQIPPSKGRGPLIALVAVIIVLGAGFGFYYLQSSSTISGLDQKISSQQGQITADNAKISDLNQTIISLQSQVATDESRINSITAKDLQANQTIASLDSQVSSLNAQITTYQSQVTSLQNQVCSLQAIGSLTSTEHLVSAQTFNTGTSGQVTVTTFTAQYAGYVLVSVSSASDPTNEGPEVFLSFSSGVQGDYGSMTIPTQGYFIPFSSSVNALPVPVVPGTVTVYLDTADTTAQTATLTVVYYY